MASVSSPIRKFVKPILYKLMGPRCYEWFQYYGKLRDIKSRLVEEAEMELLPYFVKKNSITIDVGANFAYYTVRMAELCPQGKVYAFEPIPATYATAKKIVEHFALPNVELFKKGVGEKNQIMSFEVPLQELGTHSAGQAHMKGRNNDMLGKEKYHNFQLHESFDCEVVALDIFFPNLNSLDFIKIDIEGAELFALRGMKYLLERHKPVVLLEICSFFLEGFGIKEKELLEFIASIQFDLYAYNQEKKKLEKQLTFPLADKNYILIHQSNKHLYQKIIE